MNMFLIGRLWIDDDAGRCHEKIEALRCRDDIVAQALFSERTFRRRREAFAKLHLGYVGADQVNS